MDFLQQMIEQFEQMNHGTRMRRKSREELLHLHQKAIEMRRSLGHDQSTFFQTLSHQTKRVYTARSLANLKPIAVKKLKLNSSHEGYFLTGKIIVVPTKWNAISTLIEDENKDVVRLSVYNYPLAKGESESKLFAIGRVVTIREPFYKLGSNDGIEMIRVDVPEDLSFVDEAKGIQEMSPIQLKEEGNKYFNNKDFFKAIEFYFRALQRQPIEKELKAILNNNTAACLIELKRYKSALEHANNSIEANPKYIKGHYRLAEACIWNGDFKQAREHLKTISESLSVQDNQIVAKLLNRIEPNTKGQFDWIELLDNFEDPHYRIGDYINKDIVLRSSSKCQGLGVFAVKQLRKGQLIVLCDAIEFASNKDVQESLDGSVFKYEIQGRMINNQAHVVLRKKIVNLCLTDNHRKDEILTLHNTQNTKQTYEQRIKNGTLDTATIEQIIDNNSFACNDFNTYLNRKIPNEMDPHECGIWIYPSYFNHSCMANCIYYHFGRFMVIKASEDINEGTELFLTYIDPALRYDQRQAKLKQHWGFDCTCFLCQEQANKSDEYNKISLMLQKLNQNKYSNNHQENDALVSQIYSMLSDHEKVKMHVQLINCVVKSGNWTQYTLMMLTLSTLAQNSYADLGTLLLLVDGVNWFQMSLQKQEFIEQLKEAAYQVFSLLCGDDRSQFAYFFNWIVKKIAEFKQKAEFSQINTQ